jgi:hypothetical protein
MFTHSIASKIIRQTSGSAACVRRPLVPVGTIDISPVIYGRVRGSPHPFASRQGRLNEGRGNFKRPCRDAEKGNVCALPGARSTGLPSNVLPDVAIHLRARSLSPAYSGPAGSAACVRLRSGTEFRPSVDATSSTCSRQAIRSRHSRPASTPCAPAGLSELLYSTAASSITSNVRSAFPAPFNP